MEKRHRQIRQWRIKERTKIMRKIISIANQKGGVGKTTTTLNLGTALALKGFKVLLIDLDPQANLSSYLGFEGDENPTISHIMLSIAKGMKVSKEDFESCVRVSEANRISYIPSDINLANAESYLMNALSRETVMKRILTNENLTDYDYVLIDCLPSLGILLVNALTASDNVIIPVQTQKFAYEGLGSLINICEQVKETINKNLEVSGIIATMAENTKMSRNTLEMLDKNYKDLLYKTCFIYDGGGVESSGRCRKLIKCYSYCSMEKSWRWKLSAVYYVGRRLCFIKT